MNGTATADYIHIINRLLSIREMTPGETGAIVGVVAAAGLAVGLT